MNNTYILLISLFIGNVCFGQESKRDTAEVTVFLADTTGPQGTPITWRKLLEVREWHNTSEGNPDPGACMGCEWHDYYIHIKYLTLKKQEVPKWFLIFKPNQDD